MEQSKKAWIGVTLIILFFALVYAGKRQFLRQLEVKTHPFESAVRKIEKNSKPELCDSQMHTDKILVAQVLDKYKGQIDKLRSSQRPTDENAKEFFAMGPIFVHPKPTKVTKQEFDRSVWSWSDARYTLTKTQEMKNENLWLDLDHAAKFLLKLDAYRLLGEKKFLPPAIAEHRFLPNQSVQRIAPFEFKVILNPGDFEAQKGELKKMIEEEWRSKKFKLKVEWSSVSPVAYKFLSRPAEIQSITSHQEKAIHMKKFVRYRTFAHEVGHVLGFDDHYYEVWHDKFCYYTQEYRTGDLMSDSENGRVTERHWEILDRAYPWKQEPLKGPFAYSYGDAKAQIGKN